MRWGWLKRRLLFQNCLGFFSAGVVWYLVTSSTSTSSTTNLGPESWCSLVFSDASFTIQFLFHLMVVIDTVSSMLDDDGGKVSLYSMINIPIQIWFKIQNFPSNNLLYYSLQVLQGKLVLWPATSCLVLMDGKL